MYKKETYNLKQKLNNERNSMTHTHAPTSLQHSDLAGLAKAYSIDLATVIDPILLAAHLHKQAGLTIMQAASLCKVSRTYIYKKLNDLKGE